MSANGDKPQNQERPTVGARLKDNRTVFLALTITLLVITIAYYVILRGREQDPALVNNQILLFFLRNVNAVLVTALAFVLVRNLTKLWFEYRGKRLGAKLKTKLVVTYIGLSLIPVMLLFAIGTEVLQGSLDTVFRTNSSELLEPGYDVSLALSSQIEKRNQINAELILESIGELPIDDNRTQPQLDRVLKARLGKLELDVIYAFHETEFVHAVTNPTSGIVDLPDIDSELLLATLRGGRTSQVQRLPGNAQRLLLGAAASEDTGSERTIIVAGSVLSEQLSEQTRMLVDAGQASRQVLVQEPEIRSVQTLTFLMVTLVLLLTCSWVGLYLARQVTVPIQALADGTRRIAQGDLEHRVEAAADDELGVLVDSFNQMTSELQRSKTLLEESNFDLITSNNELDQARERIGTVLRSVSTGVISIDQERRITTCNDAAGQMLNLEPKSIEGKDLQAALNQHEALHNLLTAQEETEDSAEEHLALNSRTRRSQHRAAINNEWKTFEVSSTPLVAKGESRGRVVVLEDLTELIRAQKLATWNEAARRIAHEIKNPLTPIKLSAERLLKKHKANDPDFDSTLDGSIKIIVREVEKMKNLVDEFARFARMPSPSLSQLDAGQMCRDVVKLYTDIKQGVEVIALTDTDQLNGASALTVAGDEAQLRSALINLIDNAIEATTGPGTVVVRAQRRATELRLQVADPGPGVRPEDKERLFLPYFSTKGRGTGLGLSIVHRIVTDHHGTIRIDDNQPHGAVFTIDLPT